MSDSDRRGDDIAWRLLGRRIRGMRAAERIPAESEFADPPEDIDIDAAKAALEQVHKRLDAQLAVKATTETRALTLAGQCVAVLAAVTAAGLAEYFREQPRHSLVAGAAAGAGLLFAAVASAYDAARPRAGLLPGRLPDEVWSELTAPGMKGAEFMARTILSLQDKMVRNEVEQSRRARLLSRALWLGTLAGPVAVLFAVGYSEIGRFIAFIK
jgi:hypothetical protein